MSKFTNLKQYIIENVIDTEKKQQRRNENGVRTY